MISNHVLRDRSDSSNHQLTNCCPSLIPNLLSTQLPSDLPSLVPILDQHLLLREVLWGLLHLHLFLDHRFLVLRRRRDRHLVVLGEEDHFPPDPGVAQAVLVLQIL